MKKILTLLLLTVLVITNNQIENNTNENIELMASSGAATGWRINKPYNIAHVNSMFTSEEGLLYGAGYGGTSYPLLGVYQSSHIYEWVPILKNGDENNQFKNPRDYDFQQGAVIVDEFGKVWTCGRGTNYILGTGSTSTISKYTQIEIYDDYNAVACASGYYATFVLMDDDSMYATGSAYYNGIGVTKSTFTQTITAEFAEENGGIKDFSGGENSAWVLYNNGHLYGTNPQTKGIWQKVGEDVKCFDVDSGSTSVYVVDINNKVMYCNEEKALELELLLETPNDFIVQVRGGGDGYGAWGYLTSTGDLYISGSTKAENDSATSTDLTLVTSNATFFDISGNFGSNMVYGYLTDEGIMKFWGDNSTGQLGEPSSTKEVLVEDAITPEYSGKSEIPDLNVGNGLEDTNPILECYNLNNDVKTQNIEDNDIITFGNYVKVDYSNHLLLGNTKIEMTISDETSIYNTFTWDESYNDYPKKVGKYKVVSQLVDSSNNKIGEENVVNYEIQIIDISLNVINEIEVVDYKNMINTMNDNLDDYFNLNTLYDSNYNEILLETCLNLYYTDTNNNVVSNITSNGTYYLNYSITNIENYNDTNIVSIEFEVNDIVIQSTGEVQSNEIILTVVGICFILILVGSFIIYKKMS